MVNEISCKLWLDGYNSKRFVKRELGETPYKKIERI